LINCCFVMMLGWRAPTLANSYCHYYIDLALA
jgi:hypothetical protein